MIDFCSVYVEFVLYCCLIIIIIPHENVSLRNSIGSKLLNAQTHICTHLLTVCQCHKTIAALL